MPSFALGQHVRHVESKRNAFVNSQKAEKMSFYFPDINESQIRWAHTFETASRLILDWTNASWVPGSRNFEGRDWWQADDGTRRSMGSQSNVVIEDDGQ